MPSVIYDHALAFYNRLLSDAKDEEVDGTKLNIFRGKVTVVFRSMGVSQSYYSQVRKSLLDHGCISIMKQGARNVDSVVVLHHPPVEAEFEISQDRLTPSFSNAMLSQRVDDISKLVGGIHVPDAMLDFEKRLRELTREVKRLGAQQEQSRTR